jgi:hypothetical protein
MIETIRSFTTEGLHVLPIKHDGTRFVHPSYSNKFDTGFSTDELTTLVRSGYDGGIAVLHGKCNPTLICLDFDEKNAPGKNLFETWRRIVDPMVYQKLVVERTKSAGYHVYFYCSALPPEKALASSVGNEEWIAARSSKSNGITYCCPSPGYTEMQGSLPYDLQEISVSDMRDLCDAAAQLNEYTGGVAAKGTQLPVLAVPSQFAAVVALFDKKVPTEFLIEYLEGLGWSTDGTVKIKRKEGREWQYIRMWRPGRDTNKDIYSANYWLDGKRLSVWTSSTPLPAFDSGLNFSHTPSMVLYYLGGRDWQMTYNHILELCETYEIRLPQRMPMTYMDMLGKKMLWKVNVRGITEWAEWSGYRWMSIAGDDDSVVNLVRVVDNIIYEVDDKDVLRNYVTEVNREYGEEQQRVLHNFLPSVMSYLSTLPLFDGELMRDNRNESYLYFANGVLRVTAGGAELIKYTDLSGCVFARHIKNIDYKEMSEYGVFGEFINQICEDDAHKKYLMSALGYVIHYHKLRSFAKAVMVIEDVEDQEEAKGRSGKGLIAQFVEWLRWTVQQDGRNYKSDSQFKMQRIVPGVQVYYLNDPAPGVLMNQFYNFITDDWLVEAKGKKAYSISFRHSPKILITTNYLPNIESDSDKDRFIVLPIKKVFGAAYAVRDAFPGVIFFDDQWDMNDQLGAVSFAVDCLRQYLREGVSVYNNKKMEDNAARRVIQNIVPNSIIEPLEQAIEVAQSVRNIAEFDSGLRIFDLCSETPDTISKVFGWEPGKLIIYVSKFYQYSLRGYKMREINDKNFGKKVRTYLDKSGFKIENETRNHTSGKRISVSISSTMKFSSTMKNEWEGVTDGEDF